MHQTILGDNKVLHHYFPIPVKTKLGTLAAPVLGALVPSAGFAGYLIADDQLQDPPARHQTPVDEIVDPGLGRIEDNSNFEIAVPQLPVHPAAVDDRCHCSPVLAAAGQRVRLEDSAVHLGKQIVKRQQMNATSSPEGISMTKGSWHDLFSRWKVALDERSGKAPQQPGHWFSIWRTIIEHDWFQKELHDCVGCIVSSSKLPQDLAGDIYEVPEDHEEHVKSVSKDSPTESPPTVGFDDNTIGGTPPDPATDSA